MYCISAWLPTKSFSRLLFSIYAAHTTCVDLFETQQEKTSLRGTPTIEYFLSSGDGNEKAPSAPQFSLHWQGINFLHRLTASIRFDFFLHLHSDYILRLFAPPIRLKATTPVWKRPHPQKSYLLLQNRPNIWIIELHQIVFSAVVDFLGVI